MTLAYLKKPTLSLQEKGRLRLASNGDNDTFKETNAELKRETEAEIFWL
jgi:hypothetical protein